MKPSSILDSECLTRMNLLNQNIDLAMKKSKAQMPKEMQSRLPVSDSCARCGSQPVRRSSMLGTYGYGEVISKNGRTK